MAGAGSVAWIVPFSRPAAAQDLFARPIAAHVTNRLGQTMVIDNKGGAGGTLGTAGPPLPRPTATRCCWDPAARWPRRPTCIRTRATTRANSRRS